MMDASRLEDGGTGPGPRFLTKACDTCHARKIKCDRQNPCSACRSAHVTCTISARPPEKRKRVTSVVSEEEVKSVSERLVNLERTLSTLLSNTSSISTPSPAQEEQRTAEKINISKASTILDDDYHSPFEGASSFSTHSKQVSQAFGSTTASPSTIIQATTDLPRLSSTLNFPIEETNDSIKNIYELPSRTIILTTLRAAKTNPIKYFNMLSGINLGKLSNMCQRAFFPIEDLSLAFMTVLNVCLWKMFDSFGDLDLFQHKINKQEFEQGKAVCRRTLDSMVRCTPLLLDHSFLQIQALVLLERILFFWVVFSMDRGLSLNLGRSPSLQDYDVTTSRPTLEEVKDDLDMFFCTTGVDLAYLQGDIYKQLYSTRAQEDSDIVREQNARALAERMIALRQRFSTFLIENDVIACIFGGYDLMVGSYLALIYQAIPSTQSSSPLHFSDECINASRAAMKGYNDAWTKYGTLNEMAWKLTLNWIYMFSPFSAFIVLFGTVITLKSEADLNLMEQSVQTLKLAMKASPGISKLHDACDHFLNLAKSYMAQILRDAEGQPVFGSFDMTSHDWNQLLDDWELGLAGENAREISLFLSEGSYFPAPGIP